MKDLIMKIARRTMKMDLNVDGLGAWDWGAGVALFALSHTYLYTKEKEIFDYIKDFVDHSMENVKIPKSVNTTAPLCSVLMLYSETGEQKYLDMCIDFADWLMKEAPRAEDGAIDHSGIGLHWESQAWIDTLFMAGVFLTRMGTVTGKKEYLDEGVRQVNLHRNVLQSSNGLFYHGYNYKQKNHMSAALWGRGNAWYTVSVPEIIDFSKIEMEDAVNGYKKQVEALRVCQAENGLWHTVLDDTVSYHEVSASAGFAYGILLGIRLGLLNDDYKACAIKAAEAVIKKVDEDGTVTDVSTGTGIQTTAEMYRDMDKSLIMPWGQGLTLLMLIEMDKLK